MEYHPYKGHFGVEGNLLKHYLPENHAYDMSSATLTTYEQSLNEIFTDFEMILPVNEDGATIEWDQVGALKEPRDLPGLQVAIIIICITQITAKIIYHLVSAFL